MALTHLADTSVLTRLAKPPVAAAMLKLGVGDVGTSMMSALELGFSGSNADEWDAIQNQVAALTVVPVISADFDAALKTQRGLAAAGLKGRKIADLLIAAVAARLVLTVVHYDVDFDHISTVTGQTTEWIVPRGSVD